MSLSVTHTHSLSLSHQHSQQYAPFQRVVLHPKCASNQIQISLTWNETPSDLDLYVVRVCVAVCCSVLQFVAVILLSKKLFNCNIRLQHTTATRDCNI